MLAELTRQHAREQPEAAATIDALGTLSYRALLARAEALAQLFRGTDAPRYALVLPHHADALAALIACDLLDRDALVIAASRGLPAARKYAEELGVRALVRWDERSPCLELLHVEAQRDDERSLWLLTSGTTGKPKCARHTPRTLAGAVKTRAHLRGQRWLLGYPAAQFAGLQVLLQCLGNAGTLVIPRSPAPSDCMAAVVEHGVQYLTCTPTAARLMLGSMERVPCDVKHVTLGGESTDQGVLDSLRAAFPSARLTHTYASTEAGLMLSASDGRAGFPAEALDPSRLRITDGQLEARPSPRAMLGYLGEQAQPGWRKTGDLAELRDGRVYVTGRADDVINVGGFKVVPSVVEEAIRNVAGVLDALVLGQRSPVLGNLVKAKVKLHASVDRKQGIAGVLAHCREQLPYYMVPRLIEAVDELELNTSQKLVRR